MVRQISSCEIKQQEFSRLSRADLQHALIAERGAVTWAHALAIESHSATRDLQPRIARDLGYEDEDGRLGVERFMRDYYLHARVIHRISRRLIARCQEWAASTPA